MSVCVTHVPPHPSAVPLCKEESFPPTHTHTPFHVRAVATSLFHPSNLASSGHEGLSVVSPSPPSSQLFGGGGVASFSRRGWGLGKVKRTPPRKDTLLALGEEEDPSTLPLPFASKCPGMILLRLQGTTTHTHN